MAQKKSPEGIQYSGFFDALMKIPRQEGIMAMYKVMSGHAAHSIDQHHRASNNHLVLSRVMLGGVALKTAPGSVAIKHGALSPTAAGF